MSTECISARKATFSDSEIIVRFNSMLAQEMENKALDLIQLKSGVDAVLAATDEGRGFYVVAEISSQPVGVLHVTYEWSPWRNATFWWLNNVFVEPEWRRKGVYTRMHHFVEQLTNSYQQVCGIRRFTSADNYTAKQAYEKLGMVSEASYVCEIDYYLGTRYGQQRL